MKTVMKKFKTVFHLPREHRLQELQWPLRDLMEELYSVEEKGRLAAMRSWIMEGCLMLSNGSFGNLETIEVKQAVSTILSDPDAVRAMSSRLSVTEKPKVHSYNVWIRSGDKGTGAMSHLIDKIYVSWQQSPLKKTNLFIMMVIGFLLEQKANKNTEQFSVSVIEDIFKLASKSTKPNRIPAAKQDWETKARKEPESQANANSSSDTNREPNGSRPPLEPEIKPDVKTPDSEHDSSFNQSGSEIVTTDPDSGSHNEKPDVADRNIYEGVSETPKEMIGTPQSQESSNPSKVSDSNTAGIHSDTVMGGIGNAQEKPAEQRKPKKKLKNIAI